MELNYLWSFCHIWPTDIETTLRPNISGLKSIFFGSRLKFYDPIRFLMKLQKCFQHIACYTYGHIEIFLTFEANVALNIFCTALWKFWWRLKDMRVRVSTIFEFLAAHPKQWSKGDIILLYILPELLPPTNA